MEKLNPELLLANIGIPTRLPGDVILIAVLVITGILFGFLVGKRRIISVLLGTYIAAMILSVVPKDFLGGYTYAAVGVFLVLLIILAFGEVKYQAKSGEM